MSDVIVNKVAQSSLITLDLEKYLPKEEIVSFDLKDYLFMELILKEKDFRQAMKEKDWTEFTDKILALHCSADAIIPLWAYMLVTVHLESFAKGVYFGTEEQVRNLVLTESISKINPEEFRDTRVVVKGCGKLKISPAAYVDITKRLTPVVKSLMFGEPCSTVPVYKQKRNL